MISLDALDDDAIARLGADLSVALEPADTYRARVCAAWNDDAAVDAAVPIDQPRKPFVLGGMKLGG